MKYTPLLLLLCLISCQKETRGEYIYRKSTDQIFTATASLPQESPSYPWDGQDVGGYPRITKEFFRCRGNPLNPVAEKKRESKESFYFRDCFGTHGLPLVNGEEFVYPILIDLLNFTQKEMGKRITVTTGHRCPSHNSYCDYSSYNYGSKHMIGAEVDFYIEDVDSLSIIDTLQKFYDKPFLRYTKGNLNVRTEAWYNDEVFIKLYLPGEGRDFDNQHRHPYIGIQVRFDKERRQNVRFDQALSETYLRN